MAFPYLPTRWLVTAADLSGDPNVFPLLPGQSFLVEKGPTWPNVIEKKSASGRSIRASLQSAPIWSFKVAYEVLRDRGPSTSELQQLWAFYATRQGKFGSFFFYDPTDNLVTNQPVGTGDGVTNSFQLTRTVSPGGAYAFVEPVYAVSGTPTVTVAGAAVTGFTISQGMITFATPPAASAAIVWSGSFMFWCHFTQDKLLPAQLVKSLWSLGDGLTFESIIP